MLSTQNGHRCPQYPLLAGKYWGFFHSGRNCMPKVASKPKPKTMVKPIKKISLSQEQIEGSIRLKAYELYLQRNGQDGNALSDWIKAEKIILKA
jgi:hypothetical protein